MVNQYVNQAYGSPYSALSVGAGWQYPLLASAQLNDQARVAQGLYGLSGYIDPYTLGVDSPYFMPTLAREQADRNYALARSGLQLDVLGTLAQQRGPQNFLAYNYLLNNMDAPQMRSADPFNIVPPAAVSAPPLVPQQQQPVQSAAPPAQAPPASSQTGGTTGSGGGGPYFIDNTSGALQKAWQDLGTPSNQAAFQDLEMIRRRQNAAQGVPGYAGGGVSAAPLIMVGDSVSGRPTGHEEVVYNPTGAPLIVEPANPAGRAAAGIPRAATGGTFNTFRPEDVANAPFLQQLSGQMPVREYGQTGFDLTVPGTETQVPYGSQLNVRRYEALLPTAQRMYQGLVETPREQGGLGLSFEDLITQAYRAAPRGRSTGIARYGA